MVLGGIGGPIGPARNVPRKGGSMVGCCIPTPTSGPIPGDGAGRCGGMGASRLPLDRTLVKARRHAARSYGASSGDTVL